MNTRDKITDLIIKSIDTPLRGKKDAEFILQSIRPNLVDKLLLLLEEEMLRVIGENEECVCDKPHIPNYGKHCFCGAEIRNQLKAEQRLKIKEKE